MTTVWRELRTIIVDENDNIVASNRAGTLGKPLHEINLKPLSTLVGHGPADITIDGQSFKMLIDDWHPEGSLNSLRIISIFSVESIVSEPNRIISLAYSVIISSLILAIILIYYFSRLLTGHMLHLSKLSF
ncbi:hypothetical protein [Paenibacillus sp. FSL H8-0332]|uniref:hypothetical protein n=1 Tax=Paenibacillus sp. FSL H8-0332 TaxID=2954742 RepID=UPI0030CE9DE5